MRSSKLDQPPAAEGRYPGQWRDAADLRVFRARPGEWHKLSTWRGEMSRLGWRLLKVDTTEEELVAVFGKTRQRNP